jgi:hypothetical protein
VFLRNWLYGTRISPPYRSISHQWMIKELLKKGPVYQLNATCYCNNGNLTERLKALLSALDSHGGKKKIYRRDSLGPDKKKWFSDGAIVQVGRTCVSLEHQGHAVSGINIYVLGPNEAQVIEVMRTLEPHIHGMGIPKSKNAVWALTQNSDGYDIKRLGEVETDFEPGNYSGDVVTAYEHMASCLGKKVPCGRLSILDGPPGTGKSYLIRSLIASQDAYFVIVPSNMVGSLSGPALLPTLHKMKIHDKPVVLILEDADRALVNRERGNLGALAEVLNLSDGLLGELLDLRIVATTNANIAEFDPAICRDGRLCSHLNLGVLPPEQSLKVYHRLTGEKLRAPKPLSLATVYRMARKNQPVKANRQARIGGNYI